MEIAYRATEEYTQKLENLILAQQEGLGLIEKLLKIDKIACLTLEQELLVQETNLLWFFSLMVTLLEYYLLKVEGVYKSTEELMLDEYPAISLLKKLTLHHLFRFKKEVFSEKTQSIYNDQVRDYLKLRKKLREIVEQCLQKEREE
jgi:hypothetical protein